MASSSSIILHLPSGQILHAEKEEKTRPVASLTKIASAFVILEVMEERGIDTNWTAVVPEEVAELGGANPLALEPGDEITFQDGLASALIASDNRAIFTLAEYIGKSLSDTSSPQKTFVKKMNQRAAELGMHHTHFANPHGMDTAKQRGKSTAADIAQLCLIALQNKQFLSYISQKTYRARKKRDGKSFSYQLRNTNELVGSKGFWGIKTGQTALAGPCLASICTRDKTTLLCVVLNATDRFGTSRALVNHAFASLQHAR